MRCAVLYCSRTGNTREVAVAVAAALGDARLEAVVPGTEAPEEETVFVGFWTERGVCSKEVTELLSKLRGKRVALFGTAGFGVSQAYFDAIAQRVEALVPEGNTLLGAWMCQGRMPASVRARYEAQAREKPEDPQIAGLLANFDQARSHPAAADLAAAKAFARSAAER